MKYTRPERGLHRVSGPVVCMAHEHKLSHVTELCPPSASNHPACALRRLNSSEEKEIL